MRIFKILVLFLLCSQTFAKEIVYVHPENPPHELDIQAEVFYSDYYEIVEFDESQHEYIPSKRTYGFQPGPLLVPTKDGVREAEGIVYVFYVVDINGQIHSPRAKVVEGCPCLASFMEHQITGFKFKPAILDGKAIPTIAITAFNIKASEN